MLTGAMEVARGAVPHRDFYANYGPGQFVVLALLFKLLGPAVWVERAWDAVVRASIVALSFRIGSRAASRWAGAATAGCAFLWLASLHASYGYPMFPALAASLAALACLQRGKAAAAGVCFGVATLFRYDMGLACLIAAWLGSVLARNAGWTKLLAGFSAVTVPALGALAALGALHGLWFDVVAFPSRAYAAMRALPVPGAGRILGDPTLLSVFLPPLACAVSMPTLVVLWRRGPRETAFLLCLVLCTVALFAKGLVRVSPLHASAGFSAALVLTAVLWGLRRFRPATLVLTSGFLLCALWPAGEIMDRLHANAGGLARRCGAQACIELDAETREAVRYVDGHTAPDEPIFVGLPAHDRIFANDVAFYFLAARKPATGWYHFDPGLQTSDAVQAAMLSEFARARPRLIVIEDIFQYFVEKNGSARSSGVHRLDAYIAANYEDAAMFGRYRVLRPKG